MIKVIELTQEGFNSVNLTELLGLEDYTHVLGMCIPKRPGVEDFVKDLEYTLFPPDDPLNEKFYCNLIEWSPDGADFKVGFVLVSFPSSYREAAENMAREHGLRFANGVPLCIPGNVPVIASGRKAPPGFVKFPYDIPGMFTLENTEKHSVFLKDGKWLENDDVIEKVVKSSYLNGEIPEA